MSINIATNLKASAAIGVFDSGVGGLSIAKHIHEQLPNESLIYVADSQFAPYGEKSHQEIINRVNNIADWLKSQNVKAIVIACNTATLVAISQLRSRINIPIIGVEPAIKPAAQLSQRKKIGLLVTQATANNYRFVELVNRYKNGSDVFIQPCPGLVDYIERGEHQSSECIRLLESYIAPLIALNIDTLVLGCTHYPFLLQFIEKQVGKELMIMETAQPVTEQLKRQLALYGLLNTQTINSTLSFYSTGDTEYQNNLFSYFFGKELIINKLHHFD